ncbi:MAG: hypothetical protein K8Q97_04480 [Candidatus Andersenbacteria bacterium]|nr:hypothetical protein [Candidatus Andersenbacteria bacterium]
MKFHPIVAGIAVAAIAFIGTAPVAFNLYSNQIKTAVNRGASPSPIATPLPCNATPEDIAQLPATLSAMDQDIQTLQKENAPADQIQSIQQAKASLEDAIKKCNYKI